MFTCFLICYYNLYWNLKNLYICAHVCVHGFFLDSPQEYGIKGFPTIKVFAPGKPPADYQGARDVKPIAEFALQQVILESCVGYF